MLVSWCIDAGRSDKDAGLSFNCGHNRRQAHARSPFANFQGPQCRDMMEILRIIFSRPHAPALEASSLQRDFRSCRFRVRHGDGVRLATRVDADARDGWAGRDGSPVPDASNANGPDAAVANDSSTAGKAAGFDVSTHRINGSLGCVCRRSKAMDRTWTPHAPSRRSAVRPR